jgi:hypothetical protein
MSFAPALAPVWRRSTGPAVGAVAAVATETQRAGNWCWLATTVSVDRCYGGATTQCQLANQLLGKQTCCVAPNSLDCNQTGVVETALKAVSRHRSTALLQHGAPPSLASVQKALAAGEPPIAQLMFNGGNQHVVLLAGHGTDGAGNAFVRLGDPARGWNPTDVIWSQANHYRGGVQWTHACWTQR